MPSAVAALTTALTGVKTLLDLGKKVENENIRAEINSAIADFQQKLIDVQQQMLAIQEEKQVLRDANGALQKQLELNESVTFHDEAYWKKESDGTESGPFCSLCWGNSGKLIRPIEKFDGGGTHVEVRCNNHKDLLLFRLPRSAWAKQR